MAQVTKLMFNYSSKKSKNYNSVEESEGFEIDLSKDSNQDAKKTMETYETLKEVVRLRVDQKIEEKLEGLPDKKNFYPSINKDNKIVNDDLEGL